jgi:hypothetical protein
MSKSDKIIIGLAATAFVFVSFGFGLIFHI